MKFEPTKREITLPNNQVIRLTPIESKTLECLWNKRGEVVSRGEIEDFVWGEKILEQSELSNTVDVYVGYVRRKLRRADPSLNVIQTVRGMGYRIKL